MALAILGQYRTREAVGAVIRLIDPVSIEEPATVAQAQLTLCRQTGRQEPSVAAWLTWWEQASKLNQRAWFETLAESLAKRSADADRRVTDLARRLTDSYRRLYALMPQADRSTLISELIASDSSELCMLGFDLAKRALLNARTVDARVGDAAIRRLADRSALIRTEAASLLSRLDQPRAGSALAAALSVEKDDAAAAAMLRALAHEPIAGAAGDIIHWLETSDTAAPAAAEAALALRETGLLSDPALVERAGRALRQRPADQLTPAAGALLLLIGERDAAIALLRTAKPDVAEAVATALIEIPDGVDPLVDVARSRPRLAPAAIDALARHRPTAAGFGTACMLSPRGDEASGAALIRYAHSLPPAALLIVARAEPDPAQRVAYLSEVPRMAADTGAADRDKVAELSLLLAKARLELKDPAGALDAMEPFGDKQWAATFDPLRVTALLWLFRLPQAEEVSLRSNVSASHWLDGLEAAIDLPYAIDIADQIRRVFGDSLAGEDLARLETADRYIETDLSGPPANVD